MTTRAARGNRRRRGDTRAATPKRAVDYHDLRNPFPPARAFSDDNVAAIHAASLNPSLTIRTSVGSSG